MFKNLRIASSLILALLVIGCSEKVNNNELEDARNQARSNAMENARVFRGTDPRFASLKIIPRGDSTQQADCPRGDGWASIDFMNDHNMIFPTKCSTFSLSLGCMTKEDFESKPAYSSKENKCQEDVPYPIPKLTQ